DLAAAESVLAVAAVVLAPPGGQRAVARVDPPDLGVSPRLVVSQLRLDIVVAGARGPDLDNERERLRVRLDAGLVPVRLGRPERNDADVGDVVAAGGQPQA